jgi:hypothetical protein
MYPCRVTCLRKDYYFREYIMKIQLSVLLSAKEISSSSTSSYNQNVACSRQDIADKLHMALSKNHSLTLTCNNTILYILYL